MHPSVTLILILHNRTRNMLRLLEYYAAVDMPIIIADSSAQPMSTIFPPNVRYVYSPKHTFTQKIEHVLSLVQTDFVVMCADDDFIIPRAIEECCRFLEKNKDYSTAQGRCIKYTQPAHVNEIRFGLLYNHTVSVEDDEPLVRLEKMFLDYRSVLYGVHRTEVLKNSFSGSGERVSNLFLNEYLTAVVPIVAGKSKELDCLYQVREYTEFSDDKTTDNVDVVIADPSYRVEYNEFLDVQTSNSLKYTDLPFSQMRDAINIGFVHYSVVLKNNRNAKKSLKKRLGLLIQYIPFFGNYLICISRKRENKKDMTKILLAPQDEQTLKEIKDLLLKHES